MAAPKKMPARRVADAEPIAWNGPLTADGHPAPLESASLHVPAAPPPPDVAPPAPPASYGFLTPPALPSPPTPETDR